MRCYVSLAILIRLAVAAGCASNLPGQPQLKASATAAFLGCTNPDVALRFAPSHGTRMDLSVAEAAFQPNVPQVESAANAEGSRSEFVAHVISDSEIEGAIRSAFGQANSEVRLEITAHSHDIVPAGTAEFLLSGAATPSLLHPETPILWRGHWKTVDGRLVPIWARVCALRPRSAVRLRTDVRAGSLLTSSLLEQSSILESALRTDPPESLAELEGKILRRFGKAGSSVSLKQVSDPPRVLRNSMVRVDVISGNLHLHLDARAVADGQAGDSIRLLIPGGHRQFTATIQPDGSAILNVAVQTSRAPLLQRGERSEL